MRSILELLASLTKLSYSHRACRYFINGAPGTGRSHLLHVLTERLQDALPRSYVLGPYKLHPADIDSVGQSIVRDLQNAAFISSVGSEMHGDLANTWLDLENEYNFNPSDTFAVLINIDQPIDDENLSKIATAFSAARYLDGIWRGNRPRLLHIFAGYWDHTALQNYFRSIETSFPYTKGEDYAIWQGIDRSEIEILLKSRTSSHTLYGKLLSELTGGHVAVILEILSRLSEDELSTKTLMETTYDVARESEIVDQQVAVWSSLPVRAINCLPKLLLGQLVSKRDSRPFTDSLLASGLCCEIEVGSQYYLDFSSWYVKLAVNFHAKALGTADGWIEKLDFKKMVPLMTGINAEAYRLIYDIENRVRNFVTAYLCLNNDDEHILRDFLKEYDTNTGTTTDIYQRAKAWQERSHAGDFNGVENPLIAFCSTRDLAKLVSEAAPEKNSQTWQKIAQTVRAVAELRDAVMHNQLIDDKALKQLHTLQKDLYAALSLIES